VRVKCPRRSPSRFAQAPRAPPDKIEGGGMRRRPVQLSSTSAAPGAELKREVTAQVSPTADDDAVQLAGRTFRRSLCKSWSYALPGRGVRHCNGDCVTMKMCLFSLSWVGPHRTSAPSPENGKKGRRSQDRVSAGRLLPVSGWDVNRQPECGQHVAKHGNSPDGRPKPNRPTSARLVERIPQQPLTVGRPASASRCPRRSDPPHSRLLQAADVEPAVGFHRARRLDEPPRRAVQGVEQPPLAVEQDQQPVSGRGGL